MTGWTAADIPDQHGRRAVVTGANSGLGYHVALELARRGAHVVLACRSAERGAAAVDRIRSEVPGADVELGLVDLADLDSVRDFAAGVTGPVDVLVDNAGVMATPKRETTAQGYELQLGTNYLGHVALTGRLLPLLVDRPGARVVTVSSGAHRIGRISFDDLQSERRYSAWGAYGQSKLAMLMFAFELDRRLRAVGSPARALAAHPGFASTNLQAAGPRLNAGPLARVSAAVTLGVTRVVAQSDAAGALPLLYAATAPDADGGGYYGPRGPAEMWGPPQRVGSSGRSTDPVAGRRLWETSVALTGIGFGALDTVR